LWPRPSQILSDLTHFAGVVVARGAMARCCATSSSSGFRKKRVLLIIVASDGEVQNRVLITERAYTPSQLQEAANYVNHHYAGVEFDQLRNK
jgi:heat-inducible transcriptional repressor